MLMLGDAMSIFARNTLSPSANLPAKEANSAVIVATIEAMAAMFAGKGKPEAEAVPEAKASPSFAPIRATI